MSRKSLVVMLLLVLVGLGVLAWMEQDDLLTWFHIRMLASANEGNRSARAARVAQVGEGAVPGLILCLRDGDVNVGRNARAGLEALVEAWGGLADPRSTDLLIQLAKEFSQLGSVGQRQVLEMVTAWFAPAAGNDAASGLLQASGRLLSAAGGSTDPEVQTTALAMYEAIAARKQGDAVLGSGRELVRACLQCSNPGVQIAAIKVVGKQGLDLLEAVAKLLADPSAEVRRAALVVVGVGPADRVVLDEILLPCLRDPDPEVRRLCESELRARGLSSDHLTMARLLIDPEPGQRLKVIESLQEAKDLDPAIWLTRLSHDPAPSVRAAAVRVMSGKPTPDLVERIDQMAHTDPSPSVCYIAGVFLEPAKRRLASPKD